MVNLQEFFKSKTLTDLQSVFWISILFMGLYVVSLFPWHSVHIANPFNPLAQPFYPFIFMVPIQYFIQLGLLVAVCYIILKVLFSVFTSVYNNIRTLRKAYYQIQYYLETM